MDIGTRLFRSALLGLAGNKAARALSQRYGMKLGARRFVAGETMDDAIAQAKRLNEAGIAVTLDFLGESVTSLEEAKSSELAYIDLLKSICREGIAGNVSLKPTQFGLAIDKGAALAGIRSVVKEAAKLNLFVRLDMEDSPWTDATIGIVQTLRSEGYANVGTVIQAYLYRSGEDVRNLTAEKINLRLVKGAYKEPRSIAFATKPEVDANMRRLIQARLDSGVYTAVATHDETIINWVKSYTKMRRVPRTAFEFQMLYGIRTPLQKSLVKEGYTVRSYVPFGRSWYPYFVRRLAERPANVVFIVKSVFIRK
ncbi:proline dehydrogenase family protein [Paenibacillus sp. sptzw28]|uniref:proline dehydrogenase family protein n=1 Tax=Paenibacillus sp. sptzw28 TaxID=715179 RepID=UPI001C6EF815|nr:proline dehydrogenase family protein [Paenibacillus sp. sptzw28]QYR19820.1 proline dehydrogenase family protein [Paenibacillus sp. sptzw28]